MRLPQLAGCAIVGVLPLLLLARLPELATLWWLTGLALVPLLLRWRPLRFAALTLLFSSGAC